jgi:hypothetical protein
MAVSLGVSSKFVLVIGDEGATLLRVVGARVRDRCFASSSDPGDSAAMADMLAQSPTTAIHPLIDILEQSFTKETIPPAGMFDAARLIQRRLDAAFPNLEIKGAHYLGRDPGSERRDKRYLLAGLAGSPALNGWIAWIKARRNPV